MNRITNKSIVSRLLKKADDMGAFPGQIQYGNRNGLRWFSYGSGRFSGPGQSLPDDAAHEIQTLKEKFSQEFAKYMINPKTGQPVQSFDSLIFAIYAKDSIDTPEISQSIPPELQHTFQFVVSNHLPLTPNDSDKPVGSYFWMTHYAGAYQGLFPNEVQQGEGFRSEEVRPAPNTATPQSAGRPWGYLQIMQVGNGFAPMLVNPQTNQMETVFRGQARQNTRKFLVGDIDIGATVVEMPEGPEGQIIPRKVSYMTKGIPAGSPQHTAIMQSTDAFRNAINNQTAWVLNVDAEGAMYAQKVSGLRGRVPQLGEETHYLNQQQVESIISPKKINQPFQVIPAAGGWKESSKEGPWTVSEKLMQHLESTDSPMGFTALRALRDYIDQFSMEKYGQPMHTPYEGFKIILVGPIYSTSKNISPGTTTTNEQFVSYETMVDPNQSSGPYAVDRSVKWVVLANEIHPSQDRMNPWVRVQGRQERSTVFESAESAIAYIQAKYIDAQVPGNQNVISETSKRVQSADLALRRAAGEQSALPNPRPKTIKPQSAPQDVANATQQPIQNTSAQPLMTDAKRILQSLTKNAKYL